MKLSDLTLNGMLTDLTKRKQVMKGSVAAGKAPKTQLGVIGISLGQKQSTGETSTSDIPMPKYKVIRKNTQGTM